MEFVEGKTLLELLRDGREFPEEDGLEIGIAIAKALTHAAQHGILRFPNRKKKSLPGF